MKLLALSGSLRSESLNRKLLALAVKNAVLNGAVVETLDLREFSLPSYDGDIEASSGIPEVAKKISEKLNSNQGLILATPEYNFSFPGHLKNMFDWVSRIRPMPWSKKNVLFLSASPGAVGANRSLWALRVPFESCGSFVYPDMFSLALANDAFDAESNLKDPKSAERLGKLVKDFMGFVNRITDQAGSQIK